LTTAFGVGTRPGSVSVEGGKLVAGFDVTRLDSVLFVWLGCPRFGMVVITSLVSVGGSSELSVGFPCTVFGVDAVLPPLTFIDGFEMSESATVVNDAEVVTVVHMVEDILDGIIDGILDGILDGIHEGILEGILDGILDGIEDILIGKLEGKVEEWVDGMFDGMLEEILADKPWGILVDSVEDVSPPSIGDRVGGPTFPTLTALVGPPMTGGFCTPGLGDAPVNCCTLVAGPWIEGALTDMTGPTMLGSRGIIFMFDPLGTGGRPIPLRAARGDIFCLDLGLGWLPGPDCR